MQRRYLLPAVAVSLALAAASLLPDYSARASSQDFLYVNGSGAPYTDPQGNTWGIGADGNPGTLAAPVATIGAATAKIIGNSVTVMIAPGNYMGPGNAISFPNRTGITYQAADGGNKPVIDATATGTHAIWVGTCATGATIKDIKVANVTSWNKTGLSASANNLTVEGLEITGAAYRTVDLWGAQGFTITDSRFLAPRSGANSHVLISGGSSGTFSHCVIDADNNATYAVVNSASGAIRMDNCVITGGGEIGVTQWIPQADLTLDSVVCFATGMRSADHYAIVNNNPSGKLRVYNSTVNSGSASNPVHKLIFGADADTGNTFNADPHFKSYKAAEGIVTLSFDDNGNMDRWNEYAAAASARGVHLTFLIHERTWKENHCNDARLVQWAADGHDVATHTYSHVYYDAVGEPVMSISYVGNAQSATARIEAGHLITEVNGVEDLNFDLSRYAGYESAPPQHMCDLVAHINRDHDYHAEFNPDHYENIGVYLKATSLADLAPADILHNDAEATIDAERFYQDEIGDVNDWLQATVGGGYQVASIAPPCNVMTDGAKAYMMDHTTIKVCRGGQVNLQDNILLRNVDLYYLFSAVPWQPPYIQTEAETKQAARAIATAAIEHGGVYAVFGHWQEFYSGAQLGWFIDGLKEFVPKGLKIMSMRECSEYVRDPAHGWTAQGNGRFTKTYLDQSDYGIENPSPVDSFPWVAYPTPRSSSGAVITEVRTGDHAPGEIVARFAQGSVEIPDSAPVGTLDDVIDADLHRVAADFQVAAIRRLYRNATRGEIEIPARDGHLAGLSDVWDVYVLSFSEDGDEWEITDSLRALPACVYAEPNQLLRACAVPRDSLFKDQWSFYRIHMTSAWDLQTGSTSVRVGVLDTGIDFGNPALGQAFGPGCKVAGGWDYVNDDSMPMDDAAGPCDSHGTLVAGIIGAYTDNADGVAGIAGGWGSANSGCTLLALKAADQDGRFPLDAVCNALRDAWPVFGADIINASFGDSIYCESLREALCDVHRMGVITVAAKGNQGTAGFNFPSDFDEDWVISVGASDDEPENAPTACERRTSVLDGYPWSSGFGNAMDVLAPGVGIESTARTVHAWPYSAADGTSMAAGHVSGLAALLLSEDSTLCASDAEGIIAESCKDIQVDPQGGEGLVGYDDWSGHGRIVADSALILLRAPYTRLHGSCQGGVSVSTTGFLDLTFRGAGPLDGDYYGKRHLVRCFASYAGGAPPGAVPRVWGRGLEGSTGWSAATPNYQTGFCRVVEGTQTETGCTLESYVYEVWTPQGEYLGLYPCRPEEVVFGYTLLVPGAGSAVPGSPGLDPDLPRLSLPTGNPAAGRATIALNLPRAQQVQLRVFDIEGRQVRCLFAGRADRGERRVEWDGLDSDGHRLAPGVYVCRLDATDSLGAPRHIAAKIVLIR
jgi:peptidoglycan/xylan/chitin deacetylase (PgdA/CDA1 family)